MPVAQRLSGCPVAAGAVGYTAKNRFVSHRLISHQFQIRAFLKCFDSIPFFQRTLIRSVPPWPSCCCSAVREAVRSRVWRGHRPPRGAVHQEEDGAERHLPGKSARAWSRWLLYTDLEVGQQRKECRRAQGTGSRWWMSMKEGGLRNTWWRRISSLCWCPGPSGWTQRKRLPAGHNSWIIAPFYNSYYYTFFFFFEPLELNLVPGGFYSTRNFWSCLRFNGMITNIFSV